MGKNDYKVNNDHFVSTSTADDTQSIKDVYEVAGVSNASINFDENGERVINLDENTHIKVGMVVFKDKKTGKLACMPQEKLLQFYDLYDDEVVEPIKGE